MLDVTVFTVNGDYTFSINELIIYFEFLNIFISIYENKVVEFHFQQKMDDSLREKINKWVKLYEPVNIQLRKIKKYFESIPDGEYFFIFPFSTFSLKDTMIIFERLKALNKGKNQDEIDREIAKVQKDYDEIFGDLLRKYELITFDTKKKNIWGEHCKEKRRCRYCNKTMNDGVHFKNIAHAISEALGNKTIISAEECDTCNSKFAETIEKDIIKYLHLYRTLYGKKGKNGVPHLKYDNGVEIKYYGENAILIDTEGVCKFNQEDDFTIPLKDTINLMNIYRALVKFVIGVIPREYLQHCQKTIDWLNNIKNDGSKLDLPPVATLLDNRFYHDQPELVIYIRKEDCKEFPFIYAEFRTTFLIFVFIVPFSDKDSVDFSCKEKFDRFWQLNKHFCLTEKWIFNDFNVDNDLILTMNLNFQKQNNE